MIDQGRNRDVEKLFDYDRASPLDVTTNGRTVDLDSRVEDIEYNGAGRRVKAYRVDPVLTLSTARVIFLHSGPADRSSFLPDARLLASRGVSSLLIDAPWVDPRFGPLMASLPFEGVRGLLAGAVVDVRKGADLLVAGQSNQGVGFVGHSLGAMIGGILSSVDKRFRNLVLLAGPGRFLDVAKANMPQASEGWLKGYHEVVGAIDPVLFVREAKYASFLFQLGLDDATIPRSSLISLFDAAAGTKDLIWYEADHYSVNEAGRGDRIEWLDARIHI